MNQDWLLHIDCKEKGANELCEQFKGRGVPSIVDNMCVGDYWFTKNGRVWAIIERKTVQDMDASIGQDGRYKDQTARLLKAEVPLTFFFIVGNMNALQEYSKLRIQSALLHIQMHKNIKVTMLDSASKFMDGIVKFYKYLSTSPTEEGVTEPLIESIKVNCKKRKNTTQESTFLSQLLCVSGMSEVKAQAIAKVYPSFSSLLKAYDCCTTTNQKRDLLKNIPCTDKLKLGPKLSERIFDCTVQHDDCIPPLIKKEKLSL